MRTIATSRCVAGAPRLQQVEVHLAAAEHDALHLRGLEVVDFVDHAGEAARA